MPRFFDGANTSSMAWMFAITFEEGSVFLKKSEVLLKLVCWENRNLMKNVSKTSELKQTLLIVQFCKKNF